MIRLRRYLFLGLLCAGCWLSVAVSGQEVTKDDLRRALAEAAVQQGDFQSSIAHYRDVLRANPEDLKTMRNLADMLSWDRQYEQSLKFYDGIIRRHNDPEVRLQKARVLGWAKEYRLARLEYASLAKDTGREEVKFESLGKQAFWDGRLRKASRYFHQCLNKDPDNQEVLFDLGQVEAYRRVWQSARASFNRLLEVSSGHQRAKDNLEAVELVSRRPQLVSGYEFVEADSAERQTDIRKHVLQHDLMIPLNDTTDLGAGWSAGYRQFSDFHDITENKESVRLTHQFGADWRVTGRYAATEYDRDIKPLHEFGTGVTMLIEDSTRLGLSHSRERLEGNSTVILRRIYQDRYRARVDVDMSQRIKAGVDAAWEEYSDDNKALKPGFDLRYLVSFEPDAVFVQYRYQGQDFRYQCQEYFSPRNYDAQTVTLDWRHELGKEELSFGARRIYTDLAYDVTFDSASVFLHKLTGGYVWDVSRRWQLRLDAQRVLSSDDVYHDQRATLSTRISF